jgi:hypothetical protein
MIELIALWIALLAACVALIWRTGSGTLLLAYFLGLSLIHVPGAINHLGELGVLLGEHETRVGFEMTLGGLAALLTGVIIYRCFQRPPPPLLSKSLAKFAASATTQFGKTSQRLLAAGCIAYFGTLPIAGLIPSLTSLISSLGTLIIVGFWVWLKHVAEQGDGKKVALILLLQPLLPLLTLATGGFIGFGIYWMLSILALYFQISRHRMLLISLAPLIGWLGMSFGVAYFESRDRIREAVWYEASDYSTRIDRIYTMFENFKLYDFNDITHLAGIDARLNQNFLVGLAIERMDSGQVDLAYGSTVPLWALVPRAIWPEKPEVGGGGDIVSSYTGLYFPPGTSVGAGQPFEFYVNFGWLGVIVGFVTWGMLLEYYDQNIARGLRDNDIRKVLYFGLPGLAMLQPGGNLMEILVAVIASTITARLAFHLFQRTGFISPHITVFATPGSIERAQ